MIEVKHHVSCSTDDHNKNRRKSRRGRVPGVETSVDISFMPDVKKGDKVIVHAGFIIERLDEKEAAEIDKVWDQYLALLDKEETA